MKKKKKVIAIIAVLFLSAAQLCGFAKSPPKLDTETKVIYEKIDLKSLYDCYANDFAKAKDEYDKRDVVFMGFLRQISEKGKTVYVSPTAVDGDLIEMVSEASLGNLKAGDAVKCYGKVSVVNAFGNKLNITLQYVLPGDNQTICDYEFVNGKTYNVNDFDKVSLARGKVQYCVPKSWKAVSKDSAFGIDKDNGKYYMLNELHNSATTECFCIFYFDTNKYVAYESDRRDIHGIEKAIIANILPSEEKNLAWWNVSRGLLFPQKSIKSSYGPEFDYYTTLYKNHTVEFVFTPMGDGLCVMVYTYWDDVSSREDLLFLMRTLKSNG